ncbi:MAG: acyl-CoA dehydrogenase family protein [Hyphomonas sp.]
MCFADRAELRPRHVQPRNEGRAYEQWLCHQWPQDLTTGAQRADKILIIARTTPKDQCSKPHLGLSLFYTDLNRNRIEANPIPKWAARRWSATRSSSTIWKCRRNTDRRGRRRLRAPAAGPQPGTRPVCRGKRRPRLRRAERAARYANERVVRTAHRPGTRASSIRSRNPGRNSPPPNLAYKAAGLYDKGQECGAEANASKYLGTEAGFRACETAVLTHGGMGYAKEYHVERMMREAMLARIAPVSREMILNFIAERVLGLPKSY